MLLTEGSRPITAKSGHGYSTISLSELVLKRLVEITL